MKKDKNVKEDQPDESKAAEGSVHDGSGWWDVPGGTKVCDRSDVGYQRGEKDEQEEKKVKDHWEDEDEDESGDQQLQQVSQHRQRRPPRRVHRNKNTKKQQRSDTDSKKRKQDFDNDNDDEDDDDDEEEEEEDEEGVEEDGKSNDAFYETKYRDKLRVKKRMKLDENWTTKVRSRKKYATLI